MTIAFIDFHDFPLDLSVVLLKLIICFLSQVYVNNCQDNLVFLNNCWFEMR